MRGAHINLIAIRYWPGWTPSQYHRPWVYFFLNDSCKHWNLCLIPDGYLPSITVDGFDKISPIYVKLNWMMQDICVARPSTDKITEE